MLPGVTVCNFNAFHTTYAQDIKLLKLFISIQIFRLKSVISKVSAFSSVSNNLHYLNLVTTLTTVKNEYCIFVYTLKFYTENQTHQAFVLLFCNINKRAHPSARSDGAAVASIIGRVSLKTSTLKSWKQWKRRGCALKVSKVRYYKWHKLFASRWWKNFS